MTSRAPMPKWFMLIGFICLSPLLFVCWVFKSIKACRDFLIEKRKQHKMVIKGLPARSKKRNLSITGPIADGNTTGENPEGKFFSSASLLRPERRPSQTTYPQDHSRFFSRLPFELRLSIYERILDYKRVHVVMTTDGKLRCLLCHEDNEQTGLSRCQCIADSVSDDSRLRPFFRETVAPVELVDDAKLGVPGALDLLIVCRRMYVGYFFLFLQFSLSSQKA